jgi:uncharacterized integral membrane protein
MSEPRSEQQPAPEVGLRWVWPALLAAIVVIPIVILMVSNTDDASISWAGWSWTAPGWIVLVATFLAGVLVSPLIGWAWKRRRRRRRAAAHERDIVAKHNRGE